MKDAALKTIELYLRKRIPDIMKRPPSHVVGCIAMLVDDDWEEKLPENIDKAIQSLQGAFIRSQKPGHAFLTNACVNLGKSILSYPTEPPVNVSIVVGSLFIEALYNTGFINLYRIPMGFTKRDGDEKKVDTPHMVSITPFWSQLAPLESALDRVSLKCTTPTRPEDSLRMIREIGNFKGPIIKRNYNGTYINPDDVWVKALDKMQQTPWRINRRVLDALDKNECIFFDDKPPKDVSERDSYNSKKMAYKYVIMKARKVQHLDSFYQGIDMDYRSRYYTIEPFLSYQGQDFARGIMKFSHGVPMTDEGLQWLAVHAASTYNMTYHKDELPDIFDEDYKTHLEGLGLEDISVDKMTIPDKINWTNHYMEEILNYGEECEFAVNDGGKAIAEKPISFLACCIEFSDYMKSRDCGEPVFITHLPIPLDGTSNGWQHLAAMARDEQTGELVGLTNTRIPHDFYVATGQKLLEMTDKISEAGKILHNMPMKSVRKQISKRGSMTRAYSAGAGTIAENMWVDVKQNNGHMEHFLFDNRKDKFKKELHIEYGNDLSESELETLSQAKATEECIKICKVFSSGLVKAIKSVCPGPLDTMKYLQNIAQYELGKFGWYIDGMLDNKGYEDLKARRKEILSIKDKTDDDLKELNDITIRKNEYVSKLIEGTGNGSERLCWTTPAGFDVVYTNYVSFRNDAFAPIKGYTKANGVSLVVHVDSKIPDNRKFASGISPNIVHSFDSAHLAMTCVRHQGTFAGIHDSFSTHASDVPALLKATKEAFIEIYKDVDILEELKGMILTNDDGFHTDKPELGNLDVDIVRDSTFFFA